MSPSVESAPPREYIYTFDELELMLTLIQQPARVVRTLSSSTDRITLRVCSAKSTLLILSCADTFKARLKQELVKILAALLFEVLGFVYQEKELRVVLVNEEIVNEKLKDRSICLHLLGVLGPLLKSCLQEVRVDFLLETISNLCSITF
jgi:hypothetical protein